MTQNTRKNNFKIKTFLIGIAEKRQNYFKMSKNY